MELRTLKSLNHYLAQLLEKKLWARVLFAMALGIGLGLLLMPENGFVRAGLSESIGEWLALPGKLFLRLVQMIMIPLIFASIITGLSSIEGGATLRKLGGRLGIYFIITTFISITIGITLAVIIQPGKYMHSDEYAAHDSSVEVLEQDNLSMPDRISDILPANPLESMLSGEMLAIVVFTIIIGLAIMQLKPEMKNPMLNMLGAMQEICMTVVKWAMKLVPYAVFGLMAQLVSSIGIDGMKGIGVYVGTVLLALVILLIIYLIIVRVFGGLKPGTFLSKIKDAQLLAFSTTSSAAVMPLSIKTAQDELGVSKGISNFVIPIGATINMDGTAVYQAISTLFIAQVYGIVLDIDTILLIMMTLVSASIGTPAIPGGGVVILASVLQGAGIPTEGVMLIIGVERILGMFRTVTNVTGDLTACVVFNRFGSSEESPQASPN